MGVARIRPTSSDLAVGPSGVDGGIARAVELVPSCSDSDGDVCVSKGSADERSVDCDTSGAAFDVVSGMLFIFPVWKRLRTSEFWDREKIIEPVGWDKFSEGREGWQSRTS